MNSLLPPLPTSPRPQRLASLGALGTLAARVARVALAALPATACAGIGDQAPHTEVVLDNEYPVASPAPMVVYRARWGSTSFPSAVLPGGSSDPIDTLPASENPVYVVLAPGWDPAGTSPPARLVVLRSKAGYGVHAGDTLHLPVSDASFTGSCSAGSPLAQADADFFTKIVFPSEFAGVHYDAATCAMAPDR